MTAYSIFLQDQGKRGRFFGSVLFFTLLSIAVIVSGQSYLGTVDDPYLMDFLSHGENRTLIMSYPLSTVVAWLYQTFPDVQWLSWIYFLYLEAAILLYSGYIANIEERTVRRLMLGTGAVVLLFSLMNITITLLTLLLIVLAMPLVKRDQIAFWCVVLAASLLRDTIVVSVLPLLAVAYLFFFDRSYFTKGRIAAVSLLVLLTVLNILSPKMDKEYQSWLDFYHARVYFTDLHGVDERGVMNEAENLIAKSWFPQDEALLPTEKIIEAAGSEFDVILFRLTHMKLRMIASRLYHHKVLFLLLFLTGYLLFKQERSWYKRGVYLLFVIGFFTLFFIRDVDRVTYPLIFLWMALLTKDFLAFKSYRELKILYAGAIVAFLIDLPLYNREHRAPDWKYRDELVSLMEKHDLRYEPALGFPMTVSGEMVAAMSQNRLFAEKTWISNYVIPAGWMSRHPYYYRSHNISGYGIKRAYDDYHDYLLHGKAAFIGSKTANPKMTKSVLAMYDKIFGCCHRVVTVDESDHFRIVRVEKVASPISHRVF